MAELQEIQNLIKEVRKKRGFVTDPLKIQLLLTEEVGEISSELKRLWSKNYDEFSKERLSDEISDVFVLLNALASEFDIDLEEAVRKKFLTKDALRNWVSANNEA